MNKIRRSVLVAAAVLILAAGASLPLAAQETGAESLKPATWDNLRAVRAKAEELDNAGKFAEALQYHLEYAGIAERLGQPALVAWGKNNAAYMIIKMHKEDRTVDLAPAKKLVEDALAIPEAAEDCKRLLESNLLYIQDFIKLTE
jgi:hypothetical protein